MASSVDRDPSWAHDPWIGPGPIPIANGVSTLAELLADPQRQLFTGERGPFNTAVLAAVAAGVRSWLPGLFRLQDTLAGCIDLFTPGLNGYGSYIDGYGGYGEMVNDLGHTGAFLYSITVNNTPGAREADVEPGAMQVDDLPGWYGSAVTDELSYPMVYTSAGNMQAVIDTMGSRNWIRNSAHYGAGPHVCGPATCGYPQAHWTQWSETGPVGQNVDQTLGLWFPNMHPAPPPPKSKTLTAALAHDWGDGNWTVRGTGNAANIQFNSAGQVDWVATGVNTKTGGWVKPVPLPHGWKPPKA